MKVANERLRVAIYSGEIPSTTFIERLIETLANRGIDVVLFGKVKSLPKYQNKKILLVGNRSGIRGHVQFLFRLMKLAIKFPGRFLVLGRYIINGYPYQSAVAYRQWRDWVPVLLYLPDVFHVQWAKAAEYWLPLKKYFNIKIVLSLRGAHINYSPIADVKLGEMYKKVFPRYDGYHAVSQAIAKEGLLWGVREENTKVIYSGIPNLEKGYHPAHKTDGPLKLLSIGRMHWKKGYNYLIDALRILKSKATPFHWTLVAPGEMPEELLYQINEYSLTNEVTWIPGLPSDQIADLMYSHDVLVLPSVEEGIANVVLEAMSVGLLVVSTDCGGMSEVIEDGKNGIMVPVRNSQSLADSLISLMNFSDQDLRAMKAAAHSTIKNRFTIERMGDEFQIFYQKICASE